MTFDPDNKIVKLCVEGMRLEGEGNAGMAGELFMQAWKESENDFEKFTAAHYVARHQQTSADKLKWDETALAFALKLPDENARAHYPSLYLNIARCYEDMDDHCAAEKNYKSALDYSRFLPDDGYGRMIVSGIMLGIKRVCSSLNVVDCDVICHKAGNK